MTSAVWLTETDCSAFLNICVTSDALILRIKFQNIVQKVCCVILVRIHVKKTKYNSTGLCLQRLLHNHIAISFLLSVRSYEGGK